MKADTVIRAMETTITEAIQKERSRLVAKQSSQSSMMTISNNVLTSNEVKELLSDYLPTKQVYLCADKELCYFGKAPTLLDIGNKYGRKLPLIWLVGQITDLVTFTNCKNIINETQIRELARMINAEYHYYKLTEIMLFFYLFKAGEYDDFYGTISPAAIMKSLKEFKKQRCSEYDTYIRRQNELQRERDMQGCIPYDEWLKQKNSINN